MCEPLGDRGFIGFLDEAFEQDSLWLMQDVLAYLLPHLTKGFTIEYVLRAKQLPIAVSKELAGVWTAGKS